MNRARSDNPGGDLHTAGALSPAALMAGPSASRLGPEDEPAVSVAGCRNRASTQSVR